jgi:hypoxia up-regulated 1
VAAVSTQEQRDALLSQLAEVEDWLYGDGEAVQAAEYRSQLATLRGVGDRLFERVAEAEARPRAVQLASGFVELARKAANSWPDLKPWLNASDVAALAAKVDNFSAWLTSKQAEQAARAPHDEPAFRAEEVTTWLARLQQVFSKLNNKRAPKPPPPPPPPTSEANATASNTTEGTAVNGTATGEQAGEEAKEEAAHDELRR